MERSGNPEKRAVLPLFLWIPAFGENDGQAGTVPSKLCCPLK